MKEEILNFLTSENDEDMILGLRILKETYSEEEIMSMLWPLKIPRGQGHPRIGIRLTDKLEFVIYRWMGELWIYKECYDEKYKYDFR